jgi:hypothetical protein
VGCRVGVYLAGELIDDHVMPEPIVPSRPLPLPLLEAVVPDLEGEEVTDDQLRTSGMRLGG